jgi:hypothetical protein
MTRLKLWIVSWLLKGIATSHVVKGNPIWFVDVRMIDMEYLELPGMMVPVRCMGDRTVADSVVCFSLEPSAEVK